jgi:hypothetical protein
VGVIDGNVGAGQARLAAGLETRLSDGSETRDETFVWQHDADVTALAESAAQFVGVPAGSRAEDHRAHDVNS